MQPIRPAPWDAADAVIELTDQLAQIARQIESEEAKLWLLRRDQAELRAQLAVAQHQARPLELAP